MSENNNRSNVSDTGSNQSEECNSVNSYNDFNCEVEVSEESFSEHSPVPSIDENNVLDGQTDNDRESVGVYSEQSLVPSLDEDKDDCIKDGSIDTDQKSVEDYCVSSVGGYEPAASTKSGRRTGSESCHDAHSENFEITPQLNDNSPNLSSIDGEEFEALNQEVEDEVNHYYSYDEDLDEHSGNEDVDSIDEMNMDDGTVDNSFEHLKKMIQDDFNNEKIAERFNVSRNEMMMAIMRYADSCFLTNENTARLCQMINSFTERPIIQDTKYFLDKHFYPKENREFHAVCPQCRSYVQQFTEKDRHIVCQECQKRINLKSLTYRDYFVILNVEKELKHLVETNADYYNNVVTNWDHEDGVYKDIYDGREYRDFVNSLPAERRHSYLTCTFNSDGVPVFVSSKFGLWPVQATPNEIPPGSRLQKPVTVAIWFGREKPCMTYFLEPIVKKLNGMSETGIDVVFNNQTRNIKVYFLTSVVDSAARAPMQGLIQWNGFFGCSWCLHPGESVKLKKGSCVKYTVQRNGVVMLPRRSEEESRENIIEAVTNKHSVHGFVKASPLVELQGFKIVNGFVPDRLHCLDLGVVRQFAKYWFNTSGKPYSISKNDILKMDEFIKLFRVPTHVTRLPRSLLQRSFWKGMCWLNWLLHYCLAVLATLNGFDLYFKHWLLLVKAIHLLMLDRITEIQLTEAENMLHQFVRETETLYSKHAMTYNVHQLLHLCDSVRNWGPLWTHSGNVFESSNGQLVGMVHAANGVLSQICRNLSIKESIRIMKENVPETIGSKVRDFCDAMENKCTISSRRVNRNRYFDPDHAVNDVFFHDHQILPEDCRAYNRLLIDKITFRSCLKHTERSDNSIAKTSDNTFIQIVQFVVNVRTNQEFTICRDVITADTDFAPGWSGMQKIIVVGETLKVIETSKISQICVRMKIENCEILSVVPYSNKFS